MPGLFGVVSGCGAFPSSADDGAARDRRESEVRLVSHIFLDRAVLVDSTVLDAQVFESLLDQLHQRVHLLIVALRLEDDDDGLARGDVVATVPGERCREIRTR